MIVFRSDIFVSLFFKGDYKIVCVLRTVAYSKLKEVFVF